MDMAMNNSMGTALHWVNLNAVAPAITVQPTGGEYDGVTPITLTVTATGTAPLTYQWQSSPAGAGTWSNIGGATSSTYEAAPEEDTDYRVVVSNAAGSVNSDAAAVTVASFDLEAWLETAAVYLDPEDVATRVMAGSDLVSLSSKGTKGAYLGKVASGGAVIGTLGAHAAIDSSAGVVRLDGRNAGDSANITLDDVINAGASTWVYAVSFTGSSNRVLGADAGGYLTITGNGGSSIPRATYYDTGDKASVAAGALADATPAIIVVQHDGAGNLLISVNGAAGTPIACGNLGAVTGAVRFLNAFTGQAGKMATWESAAPADLAAGVTALMEHYGIS